MTASHFLRSGIDLIILDMLRPLADAGVSPDVFANFLRELKSKTHIRSFIAYLQELVFKHEHMLLRSEDVVMFSGLTSKLGYDERSPSLALLSSTYLEYHNELRPYFDLEMKKRGGEEYHVDVSYKVSDEFAHSPAPTQQRIQWPLMQPTLLCPLRCAPPDSKAHRAAQR